MYILLLSLYRHSSATWWWSGGVHTAVPTTAVPTTAVPTTAVPTTAVPTIAILRSPGEDMKKVVYKLFV